MSEDGIHGTRASVEQFARDNPHYNDTDGKVHKPVLRPKHTGGHPPISHKPPAQKHVAVPTTQHSQFTKKTCELVEISATCQHDGRKAIKEKDGEYVLNVVPHDGGLSTPGNTKKSQGVGTKPTQTDAQKKTEETEREKTSQDLDSQQGRLDQRAAKLKARKDTNTRKYRQAVSRLNRDKSSHNTKKEEFIKDNRAKNYFAAELYLDQGNPAVADKITFHAKMARKCGKHPAWALWDCSTNEWVDTCDKDDWPTEALIPPVVDSNTLPSVLPKVLDTEYNAFWLKGLKPRQYKATLYTCDGEEVVHINVYPLVQSGIDITIEHEGSTNKPAEGSWAARISESKEKFQSVVETISSVIPGGLTVTPEILPEGKFSLSNKWAEEEETNEVVWEADAVVEATLIKLTVIKPMIGGLPDFVMKAVRNIADAGIDIKLTLEAKANVTCKWKQPPEKEVKFDASGGISGEVNLGIHAHLNANVLRQNVLSLDGEAKTVAEISSTASRKEEGGGEKLILETKGQWKQPLVLIGSVTYFTRRPRTISYNVFGAMPEHSFGKISLW